MDPLEWEAEPAVDPCADVLGLEVTLVPGLVLIIPVWPPPDEPPIPPLNQLVEAPRAKDGAGAECGAIMAWGMELSCAARSSDVGALGPRRDAGAPWPRESGAAVEWTMDLGFADPFESTVDCVVSLVGAMKLGTGAAAARKLIPSPGKGMRAPALIAPLASWPARITVDGTAAS